MCRLNSCLGINCNFAQWIPNSLAKVMVTTKIMFQLLQLFARCSLKTISIKWGEVICLVGWLLLFLRQSGQFYLLAVVCVGHIQYWRVCDTFCARGVCSWCICSPGAPGPISGQCRWHSELSATRNQQNSLKSKTEESNYPATLALTKLISSFLCRWVLTEAGRRAEASAP